MNKSFATLARVDLHRPAMSARTTPFLCGESLRDAVSCDAAQPWQVSPRQTRGSIVYRCGLGGTAAGTNFDQIVTGGPLFLTGTSLELSSLNIPTGSNSYTIINVTNTGLTLGPFNGQPDGATFTSLQGHQFRINYHGGDGNDVVVTRVDPVPPGPHITGIATLPGGQMQISATGIPGHS